MRRVVLVLFTFCIGAAPATAATRSVTGPSPGAWCAAVIQINTKYGTMKNKHYLPANQVTDKQRFAVYEASLKARSQLLAITPAAIKKSMADELAFFANLKANKYATTTPLTPLTIADIKQLTAYQRTQCGITGL